jgi:PAS domain S-box-containing protein
VDSPKPSDSDIPAERAIRDSEERFRTLVTHSPTGILLGDGRTLRFANRAAARLLGADGPESLVGKQLFDIVAPEFHSAARERIDTLLETGTAVAPMEQEYVRMDGARIPVEVVAVPLDLAEGRLIYSLFQDIGERKAAERALRDSLREKEVLLREIHHRVKNNMAVIAGLLEMQLGEVEDPVARNALRDSRARVRAMSIIHETLHLSENLAEVPLEDYLRNLCGHLFSLHGSEAAGIRLEISAPEVRLDANQAVPAGLAVTELVTNALKYAFPEGRGGTLTIEGASRIDGWIEVVVRDDGAGLPRGFDPETAGTLGMRLVSLLLTRQLHGRWSWRGNGGATFRLRWPRSA